MQQIQTNDNVLDGHADISVARRTAVKLATTPKIYVAIPIGGKVINSVLPCPTCEQTFSVNDGHTVPFMVPIQFMLQHMNWVPPLNVSMAYGVKTGVRSPIARQILTMEAIRQGAEYIFYVDDDTLIPPLGLYTLYNFMEQNPHAGAVSGVYTTRENPNEPLIYKEHGDGCSWDFEMGPEATPELIFGAGAGCLLARVSHIKEWMEKNPETPIWADAKDLPTTEGEGSVMWGHDIRFCREMNLAGFPVYVDGRVLCGHFDIRTGKTFEVPATAPGFKHKANVNTADYWDQVYGAEGADNWRKYPEMFQKIRNVVLEFSQRDVALAKYTAVTELGCGVGILGSKLTAETSVRWLGFDLSPAAVDMCKARFLNAHVRDIREIEPHLLATHLHTAVVMSETLEHLDREDGVNVLRTFKDSTAKMLIITTPNNCMGPDEVPEHTALFNVEYVTSMLEDAGLINDEVKVQFEDADAHHMICVIERI